MKISLLQETTQTQSLNKSMNVFCKLRYAMMLALLTCFVLTTNTTSAQTINEGFEEAVWAASVPTTNAANSSTIPVSSYSTIGTGSTYNTGSWWYSSAYLVTANATGASSSKTYTTHSGTYAFHLSAGSSSFIMTPVITNGVVSVTFYARTASTSAALIMGVATATNLTTSAPNITSGTQWSNLSTMTINSTLGVVQTTYSITVGGGATSNPVYLKWQRSSSEITIDDIVITTTAVGPTLTPSPTSLSFATRT